MKLKEIKNKIMDKLMKKKYTRVEGEFFIMSDGTFKIDDLELGDEDTVQIKIKVLKKIIKDAKENNGGDIDE